MGKSKELKKEPEYQNQVVIVGRCSGPGEEKELPSGDKVVEFRIIVGRDDRDGYDTFDVALWSSVLRKRGIALKSDEWVEIIGTLRRRFWKVGAVSASRWQVEARQLRRI
ncbi:MAG: single-stranded DNA-binding protein [Candidatus Nanopelagicaceae bacterium]|nr:single-stranded DNA-binding protein [Candidatus Nanopelagicaceae bacterium]